MEGMPKKEKGKKRKSGAGNSTTRGATKEEAGTLHQEKCTGCHDLAKWPSHYSYFFSFLFFFFYLGLTT